MTAKDMASVPPDRRLHLFKARVEGRDDLPHLMKVLPVMHKTGISNVPYQVRYMLNLHRFLGRNLTGKIRFGFIALILYYIFRRGGRLVWELTFGSCGVFLAFIGIQFMIEYSIAALYKPDFLIKFKLSDCQECIKLGRATTDCQKCHGYGINVEERNDADLK